jgi:hypothetical protein
MSKRSRNRAYWDDLAWQYVEAGERAWAQKEPAWGIWRVSEAELQIFPKRLSGKDAIELGGTAYMYRQRYGEPTGPRTTADLNKPLQL